MRLHVPLLNKALFELGALPYDLITTHPIWREHSREMLARAPNPGGRRLVLDLGCGPGVSAIEMQLASRGDTVVGLDLAAAMLGRARRNLVAAGLPDLPLVRGDALRLPLRDSCADVATGHSFLYLLPDRAQALAEIRRTLKPDGTLVLLEPAAGFQGRGLVRFLSTPTFAVTMSLWRLASRAAGRFTPQTLTRTLEAAGFEGVTVTRELHGLGHLATARPARAVRRVAS